MLVLPFFPFSDVSVVAPFSPCSVVMAKFLGVVTLGAGVGASTEEETVGNGGAGVAVEDRSVSLSVEVDEAVEVVRAEVDLKVVVVVVDVVDVLWRRSSLRRRSDRGKIRRRDTRPSWHEVRVTVTKSINSGSLRFIVAV